ncbi:MAG: alcohol dehydrogenase catalytic domain-containing protein, partial [Cyclobacteriaceae bacterium]|nr:alcohol dehydrogenase catalytic domain-containing protein [Cyclobacteriaceae bacterium]
MKAYLLKTTGKPETLKIHEVPEPTTGKGEVKVKIKKIGINYAEILSRKGYYSWAPKRPYIPGMESYGIIEEVGEGVSSERIGEKVIVGSQYGNYAEKIVVNEKQALPHIEGFSEQENAAFIVNYLTA